jgi:molybdate transport system substrate-binding protein
MLVAVAAPGVAQTNAPLTVLASVAVKGAFEQLGPLFEKTAARRVVMQYDSGAAITRRVAAGEAFDVVITSAAGVDDFVKTGAVAADAHAIVGTAVASLAYKDGMPKPDISTPEALRAVVLGAKTISFSDPAAGGASSVYFAGVLDRLGIADAIKQKATLTKPGDGAGPVGSGQAEIGVAQSSEIALVPGVDGVPIFPSDPKSKSIYAAGVSSKSTQPDAARAFLRFLLSPEGAAIRKAKGLGAG